MQSLFFLFFALNRASPVVNGFNDTYHFSFKSLRFFFSFPSPPSVSGFVFFLGRFGLPFPCRLSHMYMCM
uniref:Secreted peptide n=1 Tax=Anopheles braziliensis TaxID=58242 RepID=A0A2M3ZLQ0_9DIPT